MRILCEHPPDVKRQRNMRRKKVGFSPAELQISVSWYQDRLLNAPVPREHRERPEASVTGRGLNGNAKVQDCREQAGCNKEVAPGVPMYGQSLACWMLLASSCRPVPGWKLKE